MNVTANSTRFNTSLNIDGITADIDFSDTSQFRNVKASIDPINLQGDPSDQEITGGNSGEFIRGRAGQDTLDGGNGNDLIVGDTNVNGTTGAGDNNDDLSGGNGGDTLVGNGGDDSLGGEKGLDTLFGGAGNDEFLFSGGDGNDTIADFGIASGNDDEITFVNTNRDSFEELVITQNGANTEINAGNVKVVLSNFTAANLTEDDFNFS